MTKTGWAWRLSSGRLRRFHAFRLETYVLARKPLIDPIEPGSWVKVTIEWARAQRGRKR